MRILDALRIQNFGRFRKLTLSTPYGGKTRLWATSLGSEKHPWLYAFVMKPERSASSLFVRLTFGFSGPEKSENGLRCGGLTSSILYSTVGGASIRRRNGQGDPMTWRALLRLVRP